MKIYKSKSFIISGSIIAAVFFVLICLRLDVFTGLLSSENRMTLNTMTSVPDRDTWMNIIQNNQKIGYSHSVLTKEKDGYILQEDVFMRVNTMGMVQDIQLETIAELDSDFSFSRITFNIRSGIFDFLVRARVKGNTLHVQTESEGAVQETKIPLQNKPYLTAGIIDAVTASGMQAGEKHRFDIFDPATMGHETVTIHVMNMETVRVNKQSQPATRLVMQFKGMEQNAWINDRGEILKENGLLGITLVKTTRDDAVSSAGLNSSQDLTQAVSIKSNRLIAAPGTLSMLKVEISGVEAEKLQLTGGRQRLTGNTLRIEKEVLTGLPDRLNYTEMNDNRKSFLSATPFIQSHHEKIKNQVFQIVGAQDTPVVTAEKLVDWIYKNIEKRPVLSVPSALSTLEHRVGDCNEHAVLLAAMARSANIPAKVEAGLVYLNGRFYYHAWNLLYVGRWITADALMGQIPVDVTHIRLVSGSQKQQLDLINSIGKIDLQIIEVSR